MDLSSVYQEIILKHYRGSRFRGELEDPDVVVPLNNPTCGDDIVLQMKLEGGRVAEIRFSGNGCAISQASASMMSEQVVGKSLEEMQALAARFRAMLHGDEAAARAPELGDLRALAGVARLPRRVKCALLAWEALEAGLRA